ncbi:MAG: HAD-IA family hydrolase [bacterium]|nr:HAD-IA family hydrolase [bacterium]
MKNRIKYIVFDLGGVLIRITPGKFYKRIFRRAPSLIRSMNRLQKELQTGYIKPRDLFSRLIRQHRLKLDADIVTQRFKTDYIGKTIIGMMKLLKDLKKKGYRIILLSNTNEVHFEYIRPKLDNFRLFDRLYASHLLHLVKPGKKIFRYMLNDLNAGPKEVLYIDDTQENIGTAKSLGIRTLKVRMNRPEMRKIRKKIRQ